MSAWPSLSLEGTLIAPAMVARIDRREAEEQTAVMDGKTEMNTAFIREFIDRAQRGRRHPVRYLASCA
jgi:hypothetical protein